MNLNTLKTLLFSFILLYSFSFTHSAGHLASTGRGVASGSSSTNPGQTSGTANGTGISTSANGSSDQSSKDSSSTQDPNKKKVQLLEINIKKQDESSHGFQVRPMSRYIIYTPLDGFGFKSIVQGDNFIWKAESDEKYSTAFIVAKKDNIKIHIQGESEKIIKYFHGFWLDESFFTSVDNSKKKPFVLDLDQESSTNQYEYKATKDGKSKTFSVKDSHAIQQIRLLHSDLHIGRADRYIFKAKDQKFYARKVVVMPLGSYKINIQVELFNGLNLKYYRPAWGSMWQCQGYNPPLSLKPTSVDINKQNSTNEIDYSKNGTNSIFTPKDGYGINSVKAVDTNGQLDQEIWSTDKKEEYASKVEVSGTGNDRVVTILSDDKTKTFKKGKNDKWQEEGQGNHKSGDGKAGTDPNAASGGGTSTTPDPNSAGTSANEVSSQGGTAGSQAKSGSESPETKPAGQQAKSGSQSSPGKQAEPAKSSTPAQHPDGSSAKASGENHESKSSTPPASGGSGQSSGSSLPKFGGGGTSPSTDSSSTHVTPGTQSSPTSGTATTGTLATRSSDKTGVTLDIKNHKDSTNAFDHKKDGKVVTYTAKGDNAFNSVKHNGNEIWSTKNKGEYSSKVVLEGRSQKKKTVTIHLGNGGKIVFHKPEKNKPWNKTEEISGLKDLDPKDYPQNIKLFASDSDDSTKYKELENTNYKVKQNASKTDIFVYELNDGSKCTLVKCDDKDAWKHDSTTFKDKYPKSINYNKKESVFLVNVDDKTLQCKKDGDNWLSEEVDASLKELDQNNYPKELKLFGQDSNDSSNPNELDRKLYKVLKGEGDNHRMFNYKLNDETKCTEIKYTIKNKDPTDPSKETEEDSTVWKQKDKNDINYPKGIYLLDLGGIIFIEFNDSFHFYRRSSGQTDWKLEEMKKSQLDKNNIKIRSLKKNASIEEMDPSEYEFRDYGFAYEYVIKSGVRLENLSYSGSYIYQYSSTDDNATYATAIYFLANKGCQVVYKNKTFYIPPD